LIMDWSKFSSYW